MGYKNDDRCLTKADEDEPIFVLRSQDRSAPRFVSDWLNANRTTLTAEHRQEAEKCLLAMINWQRDHPDRVKSPD